jgi:nucleoside-diphosphate-sugar epimerase
MTVFVAGGSGAIGKPLIRALVTGGYRVVATTRKPDNQTMLRSLGAIPAVVDALDAVSLEQAVRDAAPAVVIHELTALPKAGPRRASELEPTNRLREEGTRNLLQAAIAAGAKRIIAGSFAPLVAAAGVDDFDPDMARALQALFSMESQILDGARRGTIECATSMSTTPSLQPLPRSIAESRVVYTTSSTTIRRHTVKWSPPWRNWQARRGRGRFRCG